MTRRKKIKEVVPPNQTLGERSDNASSGPPSLLLVFFVENWVENTTVRPLSLDWSNYLSNQKSSLSSMNFSLEAATSLVSAVNPSNTLQ